MRRTALVLAAAAGVALGLGAEAAAFGWGDPRRWIPDLVVGWTFIGFGLIATQRRSESLAGPLLAATGFTWFLGNFARVGVDAVAWPAAHVLFLHRGPLIHLVLTFPTGRTRSRLTALAIAAGYVGSLINPVWQNEAATIAIAAVLVALGVFEYRRSIGRSRAAKRTGLQAAAAFGLLLAGEAAARLALGAGAANDQLLLAYEVVVVGIGAGLFLALLASPWERAGVADLVVELGEARSGTLRGELSRALGDPTLEVAYWLPDTGAFVDAEGRSVPLPDADAERSVTMIERDGQRIAALIHDPAVLDDPGLLEAVSLAAQLAASNARLQAEVRARLEDLVASRRRVLEAGDEERARLARRLQQGAERRLSELGERLRNAHARANGDETRERIGRAEAQVAQTLQDLGELAQGLSPRVLTEAGLAGAVAEVAGRVPLPVEAAIADGRLPPQVEAAAYFVCSEAIANVVKYASASWVRVTVTTEGGRVTVAVEDDGVGGADLNRGSGLRGLADRVEAIGGTLRLHSPAGEGTRLTAEISLGTASG
jgi:signal transduction histidine kinase